MVEQMERRYCDSREIRSVQLEKGVVEENTLLAARCCEHEHKVRSRRCQKARTATTISLSLSLMRQAYR